MAVLSQRERKQESEMFPEPSPSEALGRGSLEERGEGKMRQVIDFSNSL
jgi:hypothetical protein